MNLETQTQEGKLTEIVNTLELKLSTYLQILHQLDNTVFNLCGYPSDTQSTSSDGSHAISQNENLINRLQQSLEIFNTLNNRFTFVNETLEKAI